MNRTPIVSVIIPTYNRESTIVRSVNSVLQQTYKNIEVIIVDDGSSDNTINVLNDIKDERLKVIQCKENQGVSKARNIGIMAAAGTYIAFQDSDDEWLPDKLEKQVHIIENSDADVGVVYSSFLKIKDDKEKQLIPGTKKLKLDGDILRSLSRGNVVGSPTMLIRKEVFDSVGMFDEKLIQVEDWDFVLRVSEKYKFRFIKAPLVISYWSKNSVSSDKMLQGLENEKYLLEKNAHLLHCKRGYRSHYKKAISYYEKINDMPKVIEYRVRLYLLYLHNKVLLLPTDFTVISKNLRKILLAIIIFAVFYLFLD
jgi:glycosyltransferase involved in cell wall biosynthesis